MIRENDIFEWKDLSILQHPHVFKIGTDAILLGAWVPSIIKSAGRILDVGTGSGVLALMMSRAFTHAFIEAIDNDENAVQLAEKNFIMTGAVDRLSSRKENIFNYHPVHNGFNLIVANPPYYTEKYAGDNALMDHAKHAKDPAKSWVDALCRLLLPDGHICVVLPSPHASQWIKSFNEAGYYCTQRMDVYSFQHDSMPSRSLLHIEGKLVKPIFERLCIYTDTSQYTSEYIRFSGITPNAK